MKTMETLAQVVARLDDVIDGMDSVATLSAIIPRKTAFDLVSDAIESAAESRGVYVGDKSWSVIDDTTAKLVVGLGKDGVTYAKYYGRKR